MRKVAAVFAFGAMVLGACSSDEDETAASTTAKAAATTAAAAATTTSAAAAATTTAAPAAQGAAVEVTLSEWKVEAGAIKAGAVTINAKNAGQFPHELAVYKGTFASLPKAANGAVDDAVAGAALVGRIDRFPAGSSATAAFTMPAGQYALLCNLVGAGQSHAARGQNLDVTVA
ncbi:MAG: hypothetical protein ACKVWR_20255 [Acidimicrobiales bacterium]